jgi:peptidoglycan/LPS O-acetylase OafA/YrhL
MIRASEEAHLFGVHFWTLAVEEQFYFCWPLIVLFVPRFVLGPVIACAMVIGVVSRVSCTAFGWDAFGVYAFTPSNLDTLALGALLAYVVTHRPEKLRLLRRIALAGGILICAATLLVHVRALNAGMMPLPTALIALWFVSRVQEGFRGWFGWMMSFPTTVYMGRISYGIYVYHYFIPAVLQPLFGRFHIAEGSACFGVICFTATMAAASASWFFFEKPINALKNRFREPGRVSEGLDNGGPLGSPI